MKLDSNGKTKIIKVFANSFDGNALNIKYFLPGFIYNVENSNLIFNGKVIYLPSSVGYSNDSYIDLIIFSMDYDSNLNWASIFDYKLNIDNKN